MIFNLILTMAGLAVTGHALTTVAYFGVQWVANLLESLVLWAEVSVVLHVVAVGVESWRTGVNLPKSMLTGAPITAVSGGPAQAWACGGRGCNSGRRVGVRGTYPPAVEFPLIRWSGRSVGIRRRTAASGEIER